MTPGKIDVSVGDALNEAGAPCAVVQIRGDAFEVNVYVNAEDFHLVSGVGDADWDRRESIRMGTCAGKPAFWSTREDIISILIGDDDESWDIGVFFPEKEIALVEEGFRLLEESWG